MDKTPARLAVVSALVRDMRMRRLECRTQEGYIRSVRELTVYLMVSC